MQIVRPVLAFDREFGMHRNWWIRDARLTGNPLCIYLRLLSNDPAHETTQTATRIEMGLGQRAWNAAKDVLLEAGFIVEIRDRYPHNSHDSQGRPKGGQKRFRLFLQDPESGVVRSLEEAVIEVDGPYEEWLERVNVVDTAKCSVQTSEQDSSAPASGKPQVSRTLQNAVPTSPTLHFAVSLIGREEDGMGLNNNLSLPSNSSRTGASEIDADLASIHPSLSVASITRELRGRVDADALDLTLAARESLSASKAQGGVRFPPAYVARCITQQPERWLRDVKPFVPASQSTETPDPEFQPVREVGCRQGVHDWGPLSWPEFERAHCLEPRCGVRRRDVDSIWAGKDDAEWDRQQALSSGEAR